jgi:hypothetical protein
LDRQDAFDLYGLQALPILPFDRPNAERAIFANRGKFVTHYVGKLDEPDLILVCFQSSDALLRYHICGAVVIGQKRKLVDMHVVIATCRQLKGQCLLHQ